MPEKNPRKSEARKTDQGTESDTISHHVELDDAYSSAAELSKLSRQFFNAYVLLCIFGLTSVFSTSDYELLVNNTISFPVLNLSVSSKWFVSVFFVALLATYFYFLLYFLELRSTLALLRAKDPENVGRRMYPWMVNLALCSSSVWNFVRKPIVGFLVHWLPPVTLLAIYFRWADMRDDVQSTYIKYHVLAWLLAVILVHNHSRVSMAVGSLSKRKAMQFVLTTLVGSLIIMLLLIVMNGALDKNRAWPLVPGTRIGILDLAGVELISASEPHHLSRRKYDFDLRDRVLAGADLTNSVLSRVSLQKACLVKANFVDARLYDCDLTGADMSWTSVSGIEAVNCSLDSAVLSHTQGAQIHVEVEYARFSNWDSCAFAGGKFVADFTSASFCGSTLADLKMNGVSMARARLSNSVFDNVEINSANLRQSMMDECLFTKCSISNSTLLGADLTGARFLSTSCVSATFDSAKLNGTSFVDCDLTNATFVGTQGLAAFELAKARVLNGIIADSLIIDSLRQLGRM